MVVEPAPPKSMDGLVRVGTAMEYQNPTAFGQLWRAEQIERKSRAAVPLVALDPFFGPPLGIAEGVGQKSLLGVENGAIFSLVHFAQEGFVSVVGFASLEAENRGIAHLWTSPEHFFAPVHPVMNDAEFARLVIEEAVDRSGDCHVQIQKQRRPLQPAEAILQDCQLDQDVGPAALDTGVCGEWDDFYSGIQSAGVIRAAEKTERPAQVAVNSAIEHVDIMWAIARAPLETKNVYG